MKSSKLFKAFQDWSGDKFLTGPAFRKRLQEKGFDTKQGTGGFYRWYGIHLETSQGGFSVNTDLSSAKSVAEVDDDDVG